MTLGGAQHDSHVSRRKNHARTPGGNSPPLIMPSPTANPQSVLDQVPVLVRRLIVLDLICGILVVVPFFRPEMESPGFGMLAIVLLLPYLVVCWRLLRSPRAKEGPGLAAGIATLFTLLAALGLAVAVEERRSAHLVYFAGVGIAHALLAGVGFAAFRQGTSAKPAWRVALRSLVDPVVYYGIVFFITLGGLARSLFR
jgi:predicted lysophospholipase L1 biosynthesis ABC-type transport system permease subunit